MKIQEVYLRLIDKLNQLGTNYGSDLKPQSFTRFINEAQSLWLDQRLKQEEKDKTIQRELYPALETNILSIKEITDKHNLYLLPKDFYHISTLSCVGVSNTCQVNLDCFLVENSNTLEFYMNGVLEPSLVFRQTCYTLFKDSIKVLKKDFDLNNVQLEYYKKPTQVDIEGYDHYDGTKSKNIDLDWEDSNAYEIINIAALLISGATKDPGFQVHSAITQAFT